MTTEELEKKIDYLTARVNEVSERLEAMHRGMSSQEYDHKRAVEAELRALIAENLAHDLYNFDILNKNK